MRIRRRPFTHEVLQGCQNIYICLLVSLLSSLLLTKYYWDVQNKKNEMGGVCSTYGGEERCIEGFGGEI